MGLVACGLALAEAFSPANTLGRTCIANAKQQTPLPVPGLRKRELGNVAISANLNRDGSEKDQLQGRRQALLAFTALASSNALLLLPRVVQAEDAAVSGERICENALGCEIPKVLPPPKRIYKGKSEHDLYIG